MPDTDVIVPDFHGNFRHGIDGSRRVMIPAKWRPKDPSVIFTVILWPIGGEENLLVLPPERWQVMLGKLKTRSLNDRRIAAFERVIAQTSAPLTLDKVGRFALPENLAKAADIDDQAEFVGRLDKFEIWSPKRYEALVGADKTVAASLAQEIDL